MSTLARGEHAALHMAVAGCGVGAGDEVRIPIPYAHRAELAALWSHPGNSHARVVIDGVHGAVCYSVPFPCHEQWER